MPFIAFVLLLAIGGAQPADGSPHSKEATTPTVGSGPTGITAGPDGNLWFTEYYGNRARITEAGIVTELTVPTSQSFPFDITAGSDGSL